MSHKSIPCPKCNRIWLWLEHSTPENPVCPPGYGCAEKEPTFKELLDKVMKRLDDIEMKINRIPHVQPLYPTTPTKPSLGPTICVKCGMKWEGAMGYVCASSDCPVQFKVTSQISTSTSNFDIESPDPDQRTWYYDGDGTKRRKE